ncbi:MAG: polysaccharide biosynthesis tyrosine autokinase [Gemmataceae bacterium]
MSSNGTIIAERVQDLPAPDHNDNPGQQSNLLMTVIQRWPLVMLGIIFGLIVGLGYYATSSPVFESKAQVLVIKRGVASVGGDSARFSYMEDYVSTQQTLIKSKKVMRAAATRLDNIGLNIPLSVDVNIRTDSLIAGVTVTRDKESGTGVIGSNVLNLAFRSGDPTDSRRILDTVITTYQEELKTVYDQQTNDELNSTMQFNTIATNSRNIAFEKLKALEIQVAEITPIKPEELQIQLTNKLNQKETVDTALYELKFQKNKLSKASNDPQDRSRVLREVTGQLQNYTGFGSMIESDPSNSSNPVGMLNIYESKLKLLRERYGDEHIQVVELLSQIEFLKQKIKETSGGFGSVNSAGGAIDNFKAVQLRIDSSIDMYEQRKKIIEVDIRELNSNLTKTSKLRSEIDSYKREIERKDDEIKVYKEKMSRLEVTRNSGGYNAIAISEPNDGLKVAPRLIQSIAIFVFLGTIAGLGLAFAFEMTDKSFRSPSEIRKRLGLPVIGHIPPIRVDLPTDNPALKGSEPDMEPVIVTHLRPKSIEAEAYRGVRTQLYFSTQGGGHQVIQVTSPNPGDGKSTLAANLAVSIAQSGKRIVLMDCDFRKPRVHKIFHVEKPDVGLASVISGDCELSTAIRTSEIENLFLLPCGPRPQNPAELLTSPEFQSVIDQLRAQYDFVIIDTPPVLAVSDPAVVAPRVDGVLLVFRMTKKARPTAERAREQLAALGANVLGVIVNGTGQSREDGYGYGYGYNYGYGYQYQYQYEYEYADNYTDDGNDSPSSYGEMERPELPPAK